MSTSDCWMSTVIKGEGSVYTRTRNTALVRVIALWLVTAAIIFFGTPKFIGGIARGREVTRGNCADEAFNTLGIWKFLFTGRFGDCDAHASNVTLQLHTFLVLGLLTIAVILVTCIIISGGSLTIGERDVLASTGDLLIFTGVILIYAVALIIYAMVVAFFTQ